MSFVKYDPLADISAFVQQHCPSAKFDDNVFFKKYPKGMPTPAVASNADVRQMLLFPQPLSGGSGGSTSAHSSGLTHALADDFANLIRLAGFLHQHNASPTTAGEFFKQGVLFSSLLDPSFNVTNILPRGIPYAEDCRIRAGITYLQQNNAAIKPILDAAAPSWPPSQPRMEVFTAFPTKWDIVLQQSTSPSQFDYYPVQELSQPIQLPCGGLVRATVNGHLQEAAHKSRLYLTVLITPQGSTPDLDTDSLAPRGGQIGPCRHSLLNAYRSPGPLNFQLPVNFSQSRVLPPGDYVVALYAAVQPSPATIALSGAALQVEVFHEF